MVFIPIIFAATNGVKPGGGVKSGFCVYTDDLLISLPEAKVGCFIGFQYVGAFAYADDIELVAPTASALRKMLMICDEYADNFCILFNA